MDTRAIVASVVFSLIGVGIGFALDREYPRVMDEHGSVIIFALTLGVLVAAVLSHILR
ncbi:hypothetical protein [Haloarchaeobius sp. HRN-SO-5]|uniref:hypothetical protein n=1 Tax=Haloarchaeobius sp. HRN-SO-5 TaxID=3446118 RepID=UPI003EBF6B79